MLLRHSSLGPFVSLSAGRIVPQSITALPVNSVSEEYAHIAGHPCPACGGAWKVSVQALLQDEAARHLDSIEVVCRRCSRRQTFVFDISSWFGKQQG